MQQKSFAVACKEFFGMRPGQTLADLMAELKSLTEKDRAELTEMFKSVDVEIVQSKQGGS